MNFEDFRIIIETRLNSKLKIELQEFHYLPYCFGNGILSYRIKNRIHCFVFDGKENILTWLIGKTPKDYSENKFKEFQTFNGLEFDYNEI